MHALVLLLTSNTTSLQLRDKETKDFEKFRAVSQKVLTLMFNQILQFHYCEIGHVGDIDSANFGAESSGGADLSSAFKSSQLYYFPLTFSQTTKQSSVDLPFSSIIGGMQGVNRGLYGVALNDCSEHALQTVLQTFSPIIKSAVGTLKVEETFTQDKDGIIRSSRQAIAFLPKDIKTRIVVLFHPVVVQNELHSIIDALLRLGANEKDIIVLTFVASRAALLALAERYSQIHLWCVCVDAVKHGKISPGIGNFKHRYKYTKSKTVKNKLKISTGLLESKDKHKAKPEDQRGDSRENESKSENDTPRDTESGTETELKSETSNEAESKEKEIDRDNIQAQLLELPSSEEK
ncbi:hypothetical protein RFI_30529 [Reticulomyxa filosa]|uniref:Phosphoribosyltransferase domain-containing protein n=1 Tax=Reticulomyxa filosa TaxID=46433 RepID=X6LZ48_RETFI|nr:hypothetical protein RFI_30529 [Reticulomyxa filosa]|eukprot:ETO06864.1 hypothetical protein RFI_30529 [Reticulomyxa filosa]